MQVVEPLPEHFLEPQQVGLAPQVVQLELAHTAVVVFLQRQSRAVTLSSGIIPCP